MRRVKPRYPRGSGPSAHLEGKLTVVLGILQQATRGKGGQFTASRSMEAALADISAERYPSGHTPPSGGQSPRAWPGRSASDWRQWGRSWWVQAGSMRKCGVCTRRCLRTLRHIKPNRSAQPRHPTDPDPLLFGLSVIWMQKIPLRKASKINMVSAG